MSSIHLAFISNQPYLEDEFFVYSISVVFHPMYRIKYECSVLKSSQLHLE